MELENTTLEASLLDDELKARKNAEQQFLESGIKLKTFDNIEDFISSHASYPIILCDFNLSNILDAKDGIAVLEEIRRLNKSVFIAIYSAFVRDFDPKIQEGLRLLNIFSYSKLEKKLAIKNLKLDYENWIKGPSKIDPSVAQKHYELNKNITLERLNKITNKQINIPVIKFKKSLTYSNLIEEIQNDTEIGSQFIIEFIENIVELENLIKSKIK